MQVYLHDEVGSGTNQKAEIGVAPDIFLTPLNL